MYSVIRKQFREIWRGNKKWTIQKHWQQWSQKTQDEDKQIKQPKALVSLNPSTMIWQIKFRIVAVLIYKYIAK